MHIETEFVPLKSLVLIRVEVQIDKMLTASFRLSRKAAVLTDLVIAMRPGIVPQLLLPFIFMGELLGVSLSLKLILPRFVAT